MRRRAMARSTTVMIATLMALTAVPAFAQESDTSTTDDQAQLEERLDQACARVPDLTTRVENVIDRINGDADTVGSLLWIGERIDAARDNGRDDLADFLENRQEIRRERVDLLELRLDALAEAAQMCADR